MGFAEGEEEKVVAEGQVINIKGDILHCTIIEACYVSVSISKNHDNEYKLFESVDHNDTPLTRIEEAISYFILWPTEFLRPAGKIAYV